MPPKDTIQCLRCGAWLEAHHCKLECPRCGYREDCSDAGLIDYDRPKRRPERKPAPPNSTDPKR